jgi:hypothetical protein
VDGIVTVSSMEETTKPVFDAAKVLAVPILSGGEKSCEVRFPGMRSGARGRAHSAPGGICRCKEQP